MVNIEGVVAPGFEPVREAFTANFTEHDEAGAAVCVYLDGQPVVDLWGGVADLESGRPWTRDTLQLVYSVSKAITATCVHLLVQRGRLDLDAPVASYWPEFAAQGKQNVPVRWLLAHRVGLPALAKRLPVEQLLAWEAPVEALAGQLPEWEPGSGHGYHAQTYGFLVGELVRRVSGRSVGRFFAEEIAAELGIEFFIGLPPEHEHRVSRLIEQPAMRMRAEEIANLPEDLREIMAAFADPTSITARAFALTTTPLDFNSPALHAAELPASNGICTAHGLARFYAALVGEVDGTRVLSEETLRAALVEQSAGKDRVLLRPTRFGVGFMRPAEGGIALGGPSSFGHPGRGGAVGFADPERGLAFGYTPNRLYAGVGGDQRSVRLVEAIDKALNDA